MAHRRLPEGAALRACERHSAAVGRTPGSRPNLSQPFAGFICSSLDWFDAFGDHGIAISPPVITGGVFEVYPGGTRVLPRKATEAGQIARKQILEALGVIGLPEVPTHDQNAACVAGVLAAAAENQVAGVDAVRTGAPLSRDSDGVRREGPMIIPQLAPVVVDRIARAVHEFVSWDSASAAVAQSSSGEPAKQADDLLMRFIGQATNGAPEICTYGWAYRALIAAKYDRFSQAYARQVIDLVSRTRPRELPGLGPVRLGAFIVSKKDCCRSDGHWPTAQYDREEWARVLGNAKLLD